MNIFDYFSKKMIDKVEDEKVSTEKQIVSIPISSQSLSTFELADANWEYFAGVLKENKALPNSYDKKPTSVIVSLDKRKQPKVTLTYESKTSDSVRKLALMQDSAHQLVNGALCDNKIQNELLNDLWASYRKQIKHQHMLETEREGHFLRDCGERMIKQGQKLMELDYIYDREKYFLNKYKDTQFACLRTEYDFYPEVPKFIPIMEEKDENGYNVYGEGVVPLTPKMLEMCILNLTDEAKIEAGEDVRWFEESCRMIQENSGFESKHWDQVIDFGKEIVDSAYKDYIMDSIF